MPEAGPPLAHFHLEDGMGKKTLLFLIALSLLCGTAAMGQVYGLLHPASSLTRGRSSLGGYLMLMGDGGVDFGAVGKGRMGLGGGGEVGGKLGLLGDGRIGLLVGADYKHQFLRQERELPINLAGDFALQVITSDGHLFWAVNSTCILDHVVPLERGGSLNPYGGVTLSINYFHNRVDDLDLDVCLNLGLIFQVTQLLSFVGEIEVGEYTGLGMGLTVGL